MESIMGLQEALPALLDLPGQGVGPSTPWNPPAGTKVPDPLHENVFIHLTIHGSGEGTVRRIPCASVLRWSTLPTAVIASGRSTPRGSASCLRRGLLKL